MHEKEWSILAQPDDAIAALCSALQIKPLTARLLYNRGYADTEDARRFLRKETGMFYDPFLMKDMERAAKRVRAAIDAGEIITVFGDYDVDGVTATTILYQFLASQGAEVRFYIPGRLEEGYGLCADAVRRIAADGTKLIITVDTGITATEEAELIASLGMGLVITDHHTCRPVLPDADAVVDPRREDETYPFRDLAGVGVAFKLICAVTLLDCRDDPEEKARRMRQVCMDYAEYTAIGTVADVMPLCDENRLIVDLGLALLRETKRPGLTALISCATSPAQDIKMKYPPKRKKITSSFIGFTIAPRINAAGRIAHADRAVELFLTDSPEEADRIAVELCDANRERQETENKIAEEAYAQVEREHDPDKEFILILHGEKWHHGVIGIVASRVTEKYHLPSILISFDGEDGCGKGSGRSIEGFNLIEGLTACDDLLVKYGGHSQAAGLTVARDKLDEFKKKMNDLAKEAFGGAVPPPKMTADCETVFADVTLQMAEELSMLEPFGTANPAPLFCLRGAEIAAVTPLSLGKHTKLIIKDPKDREVQRTAMLFGTRTENFGYRVGDTVDVLYQMDVNEFQGSRTVQMLLQDLKIASGTLSANEREMHIYEQLRAGIAVLTPECRSGADMIPDRAVCAKVYLSLKSMTENGAKPLICTLEQLGYHTGISLCRLRLILDIFCEAGLLETENEPGSGIRVTLCHTGGKKDLAGTPTVLYLRKLYGENRQDEGEGERV
ncbi:MAG: single-stranded-DNA-specific exonuclease RecJ [Clostridia bacterium]|nr:single-stranded-DNA-specific exonuclease RecJ [Clostridia bacterium]